MSFDPTALTNADYAKLREAAAAKAAVEDDNARGRLHEACYAVLEKFAARSPDETAVTGGAPGGIWGSKAEAWIRDVESRLPADMRRDIRSFRYYDIPTGGQLVISVASAEAEVPTPCARDEVPAQADDAPPTRGGKRARKAE
jgi:hypothetical protein